ncbi:MAG: MBL fold metallo-hydrolase, partial [Candidatus Bilamarchaeaceae archaeon]
MEVIFLGTGGGRINLINQVRGTGGFIISGTKNIHVDPGPGALVAMKQMGLSPLKTDIIVVTHCHIDHCGDAAVLNEGMSHYGLDKKGALIAASDFIEGTTNGPRISVFHYSRVGKVVKALPGKTYEFEGGRFHFKKGVHEEFPAFGFVLEMDGKKIGYTGDTEKYEGMEEAYDGCDLLILNAMKPDEDQYKGHLTSEEASHIIGRVQPKLAVLTHMGMKMQHYPAEKRAREIEEETGLE